MSELSDSEVQTIFTSPPYWNKRTYSEEKGLGNEKTSEEFVVNLSEHLKDCKRVLNDKGSFFLNLGDTFHKRKTSHYETTFKQNEGKYYLKTFDEIFQISWNSNAPNIVHRISCQSKTNFPVT